MWLLVGAGSGGAGAVGWGAKCREPPTAQLGCGRRAAPAPRVPLGPSPIPRRSNLSEGITICDPSVPDCPVVYCNDAFLRCGALAQGGAQGCVARWPAAARRGDCARPRPTMALTCAYPYPHPHPHPWCSITGYTRREVIGRNCRFLQGPRTDASAVQLLATALREVRGQRAAGQRQSNPYPCTPAAAHPHARSCFSMHARVLTSSSASPSLPQLFTCLALSAGARDLG